MKYCITNNNYIEQYINNDDISLNNNDDESLNNNDDVSFNNMMMYHYFLMIYIIICAYQ